MKVNPNRDLQAADPTAPVKPAKRPAVSAPADFQSSSQLASKLAAAPTVRADKVTHAKALIADPNYPNAKTVRAIASQLADKIQTPFDPKS